MEEELQRTKIDSAIKVGLLAENAEDVEYLTFKLKEKLKEKEQVLELDESGNIKGWAGYVEDLKYSFRTNSATRRTRESLMDSSRLRKMNSRILA